VICAARARGGQGRREAGEAPAVEVLAAARGALDARAQDVDPGASRVAAGSAARPRGGPSDARRPPARARAADEPTRSPRCEARRVRPRDPVGGAGGMAALLSRHRHVDGPGRGDGAARLAALRLAAGADGLPRPGAERVLERRPRAARGDHQGGQWTPAAPARRGRVALPPPPRRGLPAARAATPPTAVRDCNRGPRAAAAARALSAPARPRHLRTRDPRRRPSPDEARSCGSARSRATRAYQSDSSSKTPTPAAASHRNEEDGAPN
jgi:hypothetical protein